MLVKLKRHKIAQIKFLCRFLIQKYSFFNFFGKNYIKKHEIFNIFGYFDKKI